MIGIEKIATYIPVNKENNLEKLKKFSIDQEFIQKKTGFTTLAKKAATEKTSDLCLKAFENLLTNKAVDIDEIDFICVCTQNGDYKIPHTSAILQKKLKLNSNCAAFDISLSCSGYVYALHIAKAFMHENDCKRGLLFTADPYSEIVSPDDKNTSLLFGDAATVTLLSSTPVYNIGKMDFFTLGEQYSALIKDKDKPLAMMGRSILRFCLSHVPESISNCLEKNSLSENMIDYFLMHQASKYVIDHLIKALSKNFADISERMPFVANKYGNTVSSSIPIMLGDVLSSHNKRHLILCGFGGGLAIATTYLYRESNL